MFGSGCSQAEGLKQWFRPAPVGRFEVMSLDSDAAAVELADLIDLTADKLSLRLGWEDPSGLLAGRAPVRGVEPGADLVLALHRTRRPASTDGANCLGTLFTAVPRIDYLPAIYGAIKLAAAAGSGAPLTVVWAGHAAQRDLCELNLATTAGRFLGLSLNFLRGPQAWQEATRTLDAGNDSTPVFMWPLADLVRNRFGALPVVAPAFPN